MSGKEHLSVGKELDTLVLSDDLTMAFVGCGDIAQFHWQGIQSHAPNIQVTAVVDTNPERAEAMAKQTGAEPFTTLEEALEKGEFDAVDIMLPHDLHAESSINAFAAGKHVVLEKPMATNIDDCERILAAANKADTVFMIAEQSQFWPDVQEAATLIKDGAIGDITHARANFFGPLRIDPNDPIPWRFRIEKSGGGICIDGGAHWIRPLRIWLGEIDEVIAVTHDHITAMEGESLAHALIRFESGVTAVFEALLTDARVGPGDDFRITGTKGEIVIERGRQGRLMLFNTEHPDGKMMMNTYPGRVDGFGLELADFSRAALEGTPLQASPEYSLGELRTALALYKSNQSKRWEKVWE